MLFRQNAAGDHRLERSRDAVHDVGRERALDDDDARAVGQRVRDLGEHVAARVLVGQRGAEPICVVDDDLALDLCRVRVVLDARAVGEDDEEVLEPAVLRQEPLGGGAGRDGHDVLLDVVGGWSVSFRMSPGSAAGRGENPQKPLGVSVFARAQRDCDVFVAHDLDADNVDLLRSGVVSAVLHHDLGADIRSALRQVMRAHRLLPGAPTSVPANVEVVTPFNLPARLRPE